MASRKSIVAVVAQPCNGGETPNAYKPIITVDLRINFPPFTVSETEVLKALTDAVAQATRGIAGYDFHRTDEPNVWLEAPEGFK